MGLLRKTPHPTRNFFNLGCFFFQPRHLSPPYWVEISPAGVIFFLPPPPACKGHRHCRHHHALDAMAINREGMARAGQGDATGKIREGVGMG